jgi:hypothetical protein
LRNKILLSTTVHVAHEMPALIISTSNFDLHFLQVNSPFLKVQYENAFNATIRHKVQNEMFSYSAPSNIES